MRNPNFNPALFDAELKYKAANITCTMCGKQFTFLDSQEGFVFNYTCGHGTKFEDRHIKIDLCCECFDEVMDFVIPRCKQNPFVNDEFEDFDPPLTEEEASRFDRTLSAIDYSKLRRINACICITGNVPAYLDLVKKELREDGFDLDATPVIKGSYRKNLPFEVPSC